MIKTKRVNYRNEMDINFFCILRKFINNNELVNIIEKIKKYESIYELEEGGNEYISNEKRRINCLYSDYGDEQRRLKNWPPEYRERILDKYHIIKNDLGRDLIRLLSNVFLLLNYKKWRILLVQKFDVFPGCMEQQIHIDTPEHMINKQKRYFISIPLHDTPVNMGPIIFYKENALKEFRKYDSKYKENETVIGYLNDLKWEIKQIFLGARFQSQYDFGDISIHKDLSYHSGGTNNTNRIREFLFIACEVKD